jgi:hypothetical protein
MQDLINPQPVIHTLEQWSVFEVPPSDGQSKWTRHFTGFSEDHPFISDAVMAFDAANACAHTGTGQQIYLSGEPDWPKEVRQLWAGWKMLHRITFERDVTTEFHAGLQMVRAGDPL